MKYLAPHKGTAIFIVIVIVISSLLFGCTKQKLEPMTNIWVSPCYIPGWLYNEAGEYLHVVYDDAYHTKDASPVTADSTMEILEESTWLAGVSATTPSYQIPDTGKLRFEVTVENASMRVESNEVFVWLNLKSETDDQWLELTTTGFRLKGKVTSYNASLSRRRRGGQNPLRQRIGLQDTTLCGRIAAFRFVRAGYKAGSCANWPRAHPKRPAHEIKDMVWERNSIRRPSPQRARHPKA